MPAFSSPIFLSSSLLWLWQMSLKASAPTEAKKKSKQQSSSQAKELELWYTHAIINLFRCHEAMWCSHFSLCSSETGTQHNRALIEQVSHIFHSPLACCLRKEFSSWGGGIAEVCSLHLLFHTLHLNSAPFPGLLSVFF